MRVRHRRDDDDDDDPRREPRDSGSAIIFWGIVGPLVGLVGLGVLVAVILGSRNRDDAKPDPAAVAAADQEPEPKPVADPVVAVGGGARPAPVTPTPLPTEPVRPRKGAPLPPVPDLPAGFIETPAEGGTDAQNDFREFWFDGRLLVGFELGYERVDGRDAISYLRPLYRTPEGVHQPGGSYGRTRGEVTIVKAKDGYAIGKVVLRGGAYLEGARFTFQKVVRGALDPDDYTVSPWYGDPRRIAPAELSLPVSGGKLPPVVGIHGKRFEDAGEDLPARAGSITSFGLVTVSLTPPGPPSGATLGPLPPGPGSGPPAVALRSPDWPIPRPLPTGWRLSKSFGNGSNDLEFDDFRADGAVLIGFELGENLSYYRPIWLTPENAEELGTEYGKKPDTVVTLKARDGFAVSGMAFNGPGPFGPSPITGLALVYSRRVPKKGLSVSPKDLYTSDWVGAAAAPGGAQTLGTQTFPVVGIHGQRDARTGAIKSIGLIVPNKADGWTVVPPLAKLTGAKPARSLPVGLGTGKTEEFEDAAPPGGWLVGFEVNVAKYKGVEVISSVRAMYATGASPSDGPRRGAPADKTNDRVFRVLAKPGYAVGAITGKAGAEVVGFSVTFMKVKGDKLDPKDAYESDWIGGAGALPKVTVGGDGAPIVGYFGRTGTGQPVRSMGLLIESNDK
jgi:hypothetical protein